MNRTLVLALLLLFIGLAHSANPMNSSFPWDIVVGDETSLKFYNNGTLEHIEYIPGANDIISVTYDPVQYRVLFADYHDTDKLISSFDLSTREVKVIKIAKKTINAVVYEPVTQLLFWMERRTSIYSSLLNPASSNKAVDGNLLVSCVNECGAIAVDSCGGFIYWVTKYEIERAAFDGSKREVLIHGYVYDRVSLVIDQQAEKMYWIEETTYYDHYSIESADLNGNNRKTYYVMRIETLAGALAISKDFIYWRSSNQTAILRLPNNKIHDEGAIVYSQSSRGCWRCQLIAANYTIEEQTLGIKSCEAPKSLIPVVEERPGSICHNYCFQGNCSVSAEGHPKCSCNRGYSGERCEVDACFMHCLNDGVCSLNEAEKPVCQCTADYQGERCGVSICNDYCLEGNCSVSSAGQPTCSCNAGYFGERCEVNACHSYCLNNGDCSLNEEAEPVCHCTADYGGERCDIARTHTGACVCADKMTQQMLLDLRSEVKQVGEDLQCTQQLYSDKLDENAAKIQIYEESLNDNEKNL